MARPPLPQTIKAKDACIRDLQQILRGREAICESFFAEKEAAMEAARALMKEALILIPYHAQTDVRREWVKRWPWLDEGDETHDDGQGSRDEGSREAQGDADA